MKTVNIIGAGLAGLSAAITLAEQGIASNLISAQPSERAQSVLAEGGINAALDTMGEGDSVRGHFDDTMKGGCFLESETAVRNLTEHAPEIVKKLVRLGVPFQSENGNLILRNFGGQAKKRTAYARASTGKMIMTALIDEARRYECAGLIRRFPHHTLTGISVTDGVLDGVTVKDNYTGEFYSLTGETILCTGGLNGFFEGMTTGTAPNTGNAAALAFAAGVEFGNLEFIQYHPTTVQIPDKRMLVSEAARGEGGRLFTVINGEPRYFMEEKYPERGNLMPRDVISREMALLKGVPGCSGEVFLDMRGLSKQTWDKKLSDLRREIIEYLHTDPARIPVQVSPGIHYFMGGIRVNDMHETSVRGLYAAGEAACKYHGANRLGGNSMLGAIFGGMTAAKAAAAKAGEVHITKTAECDCDSDAGARVSLKNILLSALGIVRDPQTMQSALDSLEQLEGLNDVDTRRALLGRAMLMCALNRKESRGAHYRTDFPAPREEYRRQSVAKYSDGKINVWLAEDSI